MKKLKNTLFLMALALILGFSVHAGATEPVVLDLPRCDEVWMNGTGDHANNCAENNGLGGCNGIVGDTTNLGAIPSGQIFCGDHRIQGCDKVTKVNCHTFNQFLCTTVPIFLIINEVLTELPPGVGIPTEWRVADSCSEAQLGEFCEQRGCDWNIPDSNPYDANGCKPAIAHHYDLCDCSPHYCGDGTLDQGEQCDDGNNANGDGCSSTCTDECGNGILDASEQCDDGNSTQGDGCDSNCAYECGNGLINPDEECDDGNVTDGDGCNANCNMECGPIHDDPGRIRMKANGPDQFKIHGRLPEGPVSGQVRLRLLNATDTAYEQTFNSVLFGSYWKENSGGYKFKVRSSNPYRFYLTDKGSEFTNFSTNMCVRVDMDGKCYKHCPTWEESGNGWFFRDN